MLTISKYELPHIEKKIAHKRIAHLSQTRERQYSDGRFRLIRKVEKAVLRLHDPVVAARIGAILGIQITANTIQQAFNRIEELRHAPNLKSAARDDVMSFDGEKIVHGLIRKLTV